MRNPEVNTLHLHQRLFSSFTLIDVIRFLFKTFMPRIGVRYWLFGRRIGFFVSSSGSRQVFLHRFHALRPKQSSG